MDKGLFEAANIMGSHGYEHDMLYDEGGHEELRLIAAGEYILIYFDEVNGIYMVKMSFHAFKVPDYRAYRDVTPHKMMMKTVADIIAAINDMKSEYIEYLLEDWD